MYLLLARFWKTPGVNRTLLHTSAQRIIPRNYHLAFIILMIIRHLAHICFPPQESVSVSVLRFFFCFVFLVQFHTLGYIYPLLLFQSFAFYRSVSHVSQMGWISAAIFLFIYLFYGRILMTWENTGRCFISSEGDVVK